MTSQKLGSWVASRILLAALCVCAVGFTSRSADAITTSPFDALVGRWTGDGVLGFKESKPERVKCRATYLLDPASPNELKQTIRCATSSGAIEIISNVNEAAGKLTGHWKETIHNFEGDLTGEVTPNGFRIVVKGSRHHSQYGHRRPGQHAGGRNSVRQLVSDWSLDGDEKGLSVLLLFLRLGRYRHDPWCERGGMRWIIRWLLGGPVAAIVALVALMAMYLYSRRRWENRRSRHPPFCSADVGDVHRRD